MEMSREHIVCVDDEEGVLTALRQQLGARFGDECQIAVARSADDVNQVLLTGFFHAYGPVNEYFA